MSGKLGRLPGITTKTVYAARPKAAGTGGASNG
jgi:hypothetical protein